MLQWYSQEKVDDLTKRKDAQGQYQIDAEFPTDKNERYYYVRTRLANIKSAEQEMESSSVLHTPLPHLNVAPMVGSCVGKGEALS